MTTLDTVRSKLQQPRPLFINGAFAPSQSGQTLELQNPATGEKLAEVACADERDVEKAVAAARAALPGWNELGPGARERLLWKVAEAIEARSDELATLETLNNGKTLREARGDVEPSADIFRYYAGWVRKIHGQTIPVDGPDFVYTLRQPVGVCAQIVPWNYPLLMASWKLAPALACGCTVVLKPSEWTPLTALALAEICQDVGIPPGVVNVLPGYGPQAGAALASHPDVDKIAFTGSIETARKLVQASAASNLKKLSLELGGKSPLLVFPDADLDLAAKAAFWGIFANKGEVCSASSRLLVHRDVRSEMVERLRAMADDLKVGDPLDPNTGMGAIVSQAQLDKVMRYIDAGIKEGARLVTGGKRQEGEFAGGLFVQPTVFDDVQSEMRIAQEEIFGPVLAVMEFDDESKGLELANTTPYGLVAAVFTRDIQRAHRLARQVQAGVVWINRWNGFDSAAPFGGMKQSGWGREMGEEALDLYTQTKCVWVSL